MSKSAFVVGEKGQEAIKSIRMIGSELQINFSQKTDGLELTIPKVRPTN
jgi:hypothetical protein